MTNPAFIWLFLCFLGVLLDQVGHCPLFCRCRLSTCLPLIGGLFDEAFYNICFVLLAGLVTAAHAEIPVVEWTRQLNTGVYGHGVSVDSSGNAYVTGRIQEMFLVKISSAVPEPGTITLLLCGLAGLALLRRRLIEALPPRLPVVLHDYSGRPMLH